MLSLLKLDSRLFGQSLALRWNL